MILKTFNNVFKRNNTLIVIQNRFNGTVTNLNKNTNVVLPDNKCETKVLKVAIIGIPNGGKSTLINNLMDRKVCATSSKVHTTRKKSTAIFTEGDSQIIFLDTPGLVSFQEQQRYHLEKSFLKDCKNSLQEADVIGVVHDVSNVWTREKLDLKIIRLLQAQAEKPSFLLFNKVDILKSKRKLLDLTRLLTENCIDGKPIPGPVVKRIKQEKEVKGWPNFKEIFMVSALTGTGLQDVKQYLTKIAKPAPWLYSEEIFTDESPESIITKAVQAKLLDFLPQEIPYNLKTQIEFYSKNDEGVIKTVVLVNCPSARIAKLVAGVSDGKLKQITESVQHDLQCTFQNFVRIQIVLESPNKPED